VGKELGKWGLIGGGQRGRRGAGLTSEKLDACGDLWEGAEDSKVRSGHYRDMKKGYCHL
jgi:hypothetical protein